LDDKVNWNGSWHANFVEHHIIASLGGIDKTRIALEYIYAHENDFNSIFWVNADRNETIVSSFVGVAQQIVDCEAKSFPEHTTPNFTSIAQR
jgi:hypothetical protein